MPMARCDLFVLYKLPFLHLPWVGFSHVVLRVVLPSALSSRATLELPACLFVVLGKKNLPMWTVADSAYLCSWCGWESDPCFAS